ncbi:MAG: hypothetical protein K0S56_929 [Microvirga sp.]|nr:hypothetical protein [Microvirga sp.]
MTLDDEEWWRAEQAVMTLCLGFPLGYQQVDEGPRSATALALDMAWARTRDGVPAVVDPDADDPKSPGRERDERTACEILTGAIQSGEVKVSGRRALQAAALVSAAEARHLALRRELLNPSGWKVEEGSFVLVAIDNGPDTTWYDLRLMAADVIRLAKRKSPHSLFYDPDKWREVCSGPWLYLADAARLRMQLTNEDGEQLALDMCSPGAEVDASPQAQEAWRRAVEDVLRGLQSGALRAEEESAPGTSGEIQRSAWSREAVDWWRSALGNRTEILVWREDIEALARPLKSETRPTECAAAINNATRQEKTAMAVEWAKARVAEGVKIPVRKFKAEMQRTLGVTSTLAQNIWESEVPIEWKTKGRPPKRKS